MDSSSMLCQRSQNKTHSNYMRIKNEENKISGDLNPSENLHKPQSFKKDVENKDPGNTRKSQKPPGRSGQSRLPVLAKTLNLQTSQEFAQSHKRWEEKPLAGKAKTKKSCTKPMPFNLSQPKGTGKAPQHQRSLRDVTSRTGNHFPEAANTVNLKRSNVNALTLIAAMKTPSTTLCIDVLSQLSTSQSLAPRKADSSVVSACGVELTNGTETFQGTGPSSAVSSWCRTLKQTAMGPANASQVSGHPNSMHKNTSTSKSSGCQASTEAFLKNMDLLSIKDPPKNLNTSQPLQDTAPSILSNGLGGKEVPFRLDHAALLSILQNEGVGAMHLGSATPQSTKPYNYLPGRVTITKSQQKAGSIAGPRRVVVPFSPDLAAAGECLVETPRSSVRTPGRNTSVYTARRVPVSRPRAETTGGAEAVSLKGTPTVKWTPQRVARHRPMSAMASMHKRLLSSCPMTHVGVSRHKSLLACESDASAQPLDKDIVQRLFDDDQTNVSDQASTDLDQALSGGISRRHGDTVDEAEVEVEPGKKKNEGGQPFLQQPHRESVIVFSTGKKLFGAPRAEKPESAARPEQHGGSSGTPRTMAAEREEKQLEVDPMGPRRPFALNLQPDFKSLKCKRLALLEDLRLDKEVATYTSSLVPGSPMFQPLRPRCGNPVASILHFHESTMFVPVGCEFPV